MFMRGLVLNRSIWAMLIMFLTNFSDSCQDMWGYPVRVMKSLNANGIYCYEMSNLMCLTYSFGVLRLYLSPCRFASTCFREGGDVVDEARLPEFGEMLQAECFNVIGVVLC